MACSSMQWHVADGVRGHPGRRSTTLTSVCDLYVAIPTGIGHTRPPGVEPQRRKRARKERAATSQVEETGSGGKRGY